MVVSWCWKQEAIAHCYSAGIAQLVKNLSALQETPVPFLGREDLLEKERLPTPVFLGFPGDSAGKESTRNVGDLGSIPGLERFPWRREQLSTSVFWPREFHEQRSLVGYSPWGCKESDTTEQPTISFFQEIGHFPGILPDT